MTITTLPMNGCDDCAWLTEGFEERTYCEECARDIAELKDATELAFLDATAPGANADAMTSYTELAAELIAMEG